MHVRTYACLYVPVCVCTCQQIECVWDVSVKGTVGIEIDWSVKDVHTSCTYKRTYCTYIRVSHVCFLDLLVWNFFSLTRFLLFSFSFDFHAITVFPLSPSFLWFFSCSALSDVVDSYSLPGQAAPIALAIALDIVVEVHTLHIYQFYFDYLPWSISRFNVLIL